MGRLSKIRRCHNPTWLTWWKNMKKSQVLLAPTLKIPAEAGKKMKAMYWKKEIINTSHMKESTWTEENGSQRRLLGEGQNVQKDGEIHEGKRKYKLDQRGSWGTPTEWACIHQTFPVALIISIVPYYCLQWCQLISLLGALFILLFLLRCNTLLHFLQQLVWNNVKYSII